MFLIFGISPRIKILDKNPRRCPLCGLHQAYYKRVDHYFNLFFIPLFRVKKGQPFIMCERCEQTLHEFEPADIRRAPQDETRCQHCGRPLERDFKYCPYCGRRI